MKKFLLATIMVGLVLTAGFVWVDSALTAAGGDCYCQNMSDIVSTCHNNCYSMYQHFCKEVYPDARGDCVSGSCFTNVYYKCTNNYSGYFFTQFTNCIDCD